MRPLVVLSLVIAAVAALLFAVSSLSSDHGPDLVPSPAPPTPVAPGPGPSGKLDRPKEIEHDRTVETSEPPAPPVEPTRVQVESADVAFNNGVQGVVLDPDNRPVRGAKVVFAKGTGAAQIADLAAVLGAATEKPLRDFVTRDDGTYRMLSLEPGSNYVLIASHPDYQTERVPFVQIPDNGIVPVDIHLSKGATLQGHVTNERGQPVVAELTLEPMLMAAMGQNLPDYQPPRVISDSKGYYRFENVGQDNLNLTARAEGYATVTERNVRVMGSGAAIVKNITLPAAQAIAGRVFGPDREGIEGAVVTVRGYQPGQTMVASATTRAGGEFLIDDLGAGIYVLTASAEGWGEERINRVETGEMNLLVEMAEQGGVSGRVVDRASGDPVPSFVCVLHQYVSGGETGGRVLPIKKGVEDPQGAFSLSGIEEGDYMVEVSSPGYSPSFSDPFHVTQGMVTAGVLVELGQGGTLSGRVVDARTGEAVRGATVRTQDNGYVPNPLNTLFPRSLAYNTTSRETRTDGEGAFTLTLIQPNTYQIEISHHGYPPRVVTDLQVLEDEVTDVGVVRMTTGGSVRGTVYDAAGKPLPGANVMLQVHQGPTGIPISGRSDARGQFVLTRIPPGKYRLAATRTQRAQGDIFGQISDMRRSEVYITIVDDEERTQDLYLGE